MWMGQKQRQQMVFLILAFSSSHLKKTVELGSCFDEVLPTKKLTRNCEYSSTESPSLKEFKYSTYVSIGELEDK